MESGIQTVGAPASQTPRNPTARQQTTDGNTSYYSTLYINCISDGINTKWNGRNLNISSTTLSYNKLLQQHELSHRRCRSDRRREGS